MCGCSNIKTFGIENQRMFECWNFTLIHALVYKNNCLATLVPECVREMHNTIFSGSAKGQGSGQACAKAISLFSWIKFHEFQIICKIRENLMACKNPHCIRPFSEFQ